MALGRRRMQIRLTRKLADYLDGIDVSEYRVGDIMELPVRDAHLLIAERWAEAYIPAPARARESGASGVATATALPLTRPPRVDGPRVIRTLERLRQIREQMEQHQRVDQERRRAEDRIREELRDERARTVGSRQ